MLPYTVSSHAEWDEKVTVLFLIEAIARQNVRKGIHL
jgi:hypothetical protein